MGKGIDKKIKCTYYIVIKGGEFMYQPNYGFNCCQPVNTGCCNTGCGTGGYGYALILVLFILLVIIGTARW